MVISKKIVRDRMDEMKKNHLSKSNWWWLESNSTTKRSPWLQSTLTELNEKTKAMLKLIEEDADSFAQRAEMYYKKRPQLVRMVEDFYRSHRSLAEGYDQLKLDPGIRLMKTRVSPFSSPKCQQSEKLISFADDGYSESCDAEEEYEGSEVEDPELEVQFVAANDEVMRLRKEIERLGEENKAHEDQIKKKENVHDEVMKLREEIELLRKENKAQKDELKIEDTICEENKAREDQIKKNENVHDEVMKLREEIDLLRKENKVQKDELKMKDPICEENKAREDQLKKNENVHDEVMKLREEIELLRKENKAQKDELKMKDTICDEVMVLREEIKKVREENKAQKDHLKQKDEEKIEVIRHLSFAINVLKEENVKMRSFIAKKGKEFAKKWKNPFEFNKLIGSLQGKLFNGIPRNHKPSVVAL